MNKKLLCILLSLTMIITMMPAMAFTVYAEGKTQIIHFNIPQNGYLLYGCVNSMETENVAEYDLASSDPVTVSVESGEKVSIRAVSYYGYKLKNLSITDGQGNALPKEFEAQATDVYVSAEFTPIKNSEKVKLSDHTKRLLKLYSGVVGDTQQKAIEAMSYWFADPANRSGVFYSENLSTDKYSIVKSKDADPYRYTKDLIYVTFLGISATFNNAFYISEVSNSETTDTMRCILDHIMEHRQTILDFLDAIEAEDYETLGCFMAKFAVARAQTCLECLNKVEPFPEDSPMSCFNLTKRYLSDNTINGDPIDNPEQTNINYAKLLTNICNTDEKELKKYVVEITESLEDKTPLECLSELTTFNLEDPELSDDEKEKYANEHVTKSIIICFKTIADTIYYSDYTKKNFLDRFRALINESGPSMYKVLDLIDAKEAEDWEGVVTNSLELVEDEINLIDKMGYPNGWVKLQYAFRGECSNCEAFEAKKIANVVTIKLKRDIELTLGTEELYMTDITIPQNIFVTIDLNGYEIGEGTGDIICSEGAKLVIKDSKKNPEEEKESITPTMKKYTVKFDMQGHGDAIHEKYVVAGYKIHSKPDTPTADGFVFGGWYKDATCTQEWNWDTDVVTGDMTLYAKWISTDVAKTSIKSLKAGKQSFTVKVKKIAGAEKYQVRYSLKKSMKSAVKKSFSVGKVTKTVKKLKAKKSYYVQVRAFKKIEGKTYYSGWSKVKKVRTK